MRRFWTAVVLIAAVGLAACGTAVIKQEDLTGQIGSEYEQQTGVALASIECDEVEATTGEKFSCTGENEKGLELEIDGEVTEIDNDTDKAGYSWKVTRAVAPGSYFNEGVAATVTENFGVPLDQVSCEDGIVMKEGTEVACKATAPDGSSADLVVTLTDNNGGFRVRAE